MNHLSATRPTIDLWDDQTLAISMIREEIRKGHRSIVLVGPPGFGKTRTSASMCNSAAEKGKHSLFLAPRRNLVDQTEESFRSLGLECGVLMSGEYHDFSHMIDVGSIDTVLSRIKKFENSSAERATEDASLILVDEGHCYASKERAKYINDIRNGKYGENKVVIILTGTPCTANGGGLGNIADSLIQPVSMLELIKKGRLLQPRYYSAEKPDLSKVKVQDDEYNQADLGNAYGDKKIMGCVVSNWKRIAPGTSTVVFCATRANANYLTERFNAEGYPAAYLDAKTPNAERRRIFEKVASGEILIICNVLIIGMGTDIPRLQTVVFATATKSISRWVQGVCRADRPYGDQTHFNVIDHGGMSIDPKMGPVEFIDDWSLDVKEKVQDRILTRKKKNKEPKDIECGNCKLVFRGSSVCPKCNTQLPGPTAAVQYHEADLVRVKETAAQKRNRTESWEEKQSAASQLKDYCVQRASKGKGKSAISIYSAMYKRRYGCWPNDQRVRFENVTPSTPSQELSNWIKHENIRFSKSRR